MTSKRNAFIIGLTSLTIFAGGLTFTTVADRQRSYTKGQLAAQEPTPLPVADRLPGSLPPATSTQNSISVPAVSPATARQKTLAVTPVPPKKIAADTAQAAPPASVSKAKTTKTRAS